MEHVRLGRTGLKVSKLCLGTMTFGSQCDEATSAAILDRAAEAGITFIDTSDVYPAVLRIEGVGQTEEILGRWLKGRRDDFVLATKGASPMGPRAWDVGGSRKHLLSAVEGSLRRLQTDYIDLYQLHRDDPDTPLDETLGTLDDMVRAGKVRYVGCSNWLAYRVARALGRSEALGKVRFDSVQPRYNLLSRECERELLPLCAEDGIGVIPFNPLAGGLLTGKYVGGEQPPATRFTRGDNVSEIYRDRYLHASALDTVEALRPLAAQAGMSMARLAVAWVAANPVVTAPIIGASRPEQLDETIAAATTVLPADLKSRVDELTMPRGPR
jgi:aryl-alcohol dehydrogenase (NADP+)